MDFITKITSVSPGDDGKALWLDSVGRTFQGNVELIDYVQRIAGLAVIGQVELEALIISYGEGSNGKSTFWNTIASVLGSYSGTISADALTANCKRNVKPELAEAKGKRLLIAAELEEGMRLSTSVVKQLCSTDRISAEKKYKDPSSFMPSHTLVLYTNHLETAYRHSFYGNHYAEDGYQELFKIPLRPCGTLRVEVGDGRGQEGHRLPVPFPSTDVREGGHSKIQGR